LSKPGFLSAVVLGASLALAATPAWSAQERPRVNPFPPDRADPLPPRFPARPPATATTPQRLNIVPNDPAPREGVYVTPDDTQFLIENTDGQTKLRFRQNDEVFYLTGEQAPMGTRVFKHDTGEVAIQITGFGGITVYTKQAPAGTPAERTDEVANIDPRPIRANEIRDFAARLSQRLADRASLAVGFISDWDLLEKEEKLRNLAADTMRNTAYALEQLATSSRALRSALSVRLSSIRVVAGTVKDATLENNTLVVSFESEGGPSARPSSLAIAKAVQEKL
jgi:hypothetical protein